MLSQSIYLALYGGYCIIKFDFKVNEVNLRIVWIHFKRFLGCFVKLHMKGTPLMIVRFYVLIMKIICSDQNILLILQGRPHFRKFQLSPDLKLLQWESPNKDKADTEGNILLSAIF